MALSPNTDNYTLGKGVAYFNKLDPTSGVYGGERDLGNAPELAISLAIEKLEHFSSRGGLKAKDKEIISQMTPSLSFTLDEVNNQNLALLMLGNIEEIVQVAGVAVAESIVAHEGLRSSLSQRGITHYTLPYDDSASDNVLFVPGETVSGATGVGKVLAVTGDATSGTLTIALTTPGFVDNETLTGDIAGSAEVDSATGEVAGVGTPIVLVQDETDTVTYVAGVDYEISAALKDDKIGRIKVLEGGAITDDETLHVTFGYADMTYSVIRAMVNTQVEGSFRFVSDNPAGGQRELSIWRVSLTPSGDTAFIGEDWSTLGFAGEILKDEVGHPGSPYMDIIDL